MAHGNEMQKQRYFYLKLPKNWFKNARIKKLRRHYKKRSGGRSRTRDAMLAFKDEMFAILMESEVK